MDYGFLFLAMVFGSIDKLICRRFLRSSTNPDQYLLIYQIGSTAFIAPFALYQILSRYGHRDALINDLPIALLLFSILAWICYAVTTFRSAARLDLSIVSVFGKLKLVWAALFGIFIFNESLSLIQTLGLILIAAATINISLLKDRNALDWKGAAYAISASFALAAALMIDKKLTEYVDPSIIIFIGFFGTSIFALALNKKSIWLEKRDLIFSAVSASMFGSASYYLLLTSMKTIPLIVAIPIHQSSFLIDILIGILVLGERREIRSKFRSALLALAGVLFISIGSL